MGLEKAILIHLLLCLSLINIAISRPPSPTGYFPNRHHPWSDGSGKIQQYDGVWSPFVFSDDYSKNGNQMSSFNTRYGDINDISRSRGEFKPQFPVYSSVRDGFVPADLSALDRVFWWKKRFRTHRSGPFEDIPFYDESGTENSVNNYLSTGGVNKRDYTASQLINYLKALAKARRQRQIRIAGKGLRFGISK